VRELEENITIGIQLGNVTFSFKTDVEGSNVKATVKAIKEIASTHAQLFKSLSSESYGKSAAVESSRLRARLAEREKLKLAWSCESWKRLSYPRAISKLQEPPVMLKPSWRNRPAYRSQVGR